MRNLAATLTTTLSNLTKATTLAMADYSGSFNSGSQTNSFSFSSYLKKFKKFFKNSPYLPFVIVGILVVFIAFFIIRGFVANQANNSTLGANTQAQKVSIAKPIATETLNKSFDFPLKNAQGKEVSKLHYEIQSAELDNQIIVKGEEATAVQGRVFLILNLKIINSYDKAIELNTRDYIRLIVDNSNDKLAADIHNDPVDVQAISTKYTRIGFPISASAKSLILQVGEIDGTKQSIKLNLTQ